jgi:hypothetical protein
MLPGCVREWLTDKGDRKEKPAERIASPLEVRQSMYNRNVGRSFYSIGMFPWP